VVPEKVKGKAQAAPVAGPETVVQVVDGEAVVVVVVVDVVTGEVVEVVVVVVVVVGDSQSSFVQTGVPSEPHTQVLQSTV